MLVREQSGKEVFICAIGEGDVFGEAGILLRTKRTANVIAADSTTVFRVHRKDLLEFIKRDPASGLKVLFIMVHGLLKKLRDANQELAFERKSVLEQEDIDAITEDFIKDL